MAIDTDRAVRLIAEVSSAAIHQVLNQAGDGGFEIALRDRSEEREALRQGWPNAVWLCFEAKGKLNGGVAFVVSHSDAAFLVEEVFGGKNEEETDEPPDSTKETAEIFRQIARRVSEALSKSVEGEVDFKFVGEEPSAWHAREFQVLAIKHRNADCALVSMIWSDEFARSLDSKLSPGTDAQEAVQIEAARASKLQAPNLPENIALFLDIELEATLRFGSREIPIGEVLDFAPGTMIELDQLLDDPVDVLVCGNVVAKGDVVMVDGLYALRVTEIVSHTERIRSLRS